MRVSVCLTIDAVEYDIDGRLDLSGPGSGCGVEVGDIYSDGAKLDSAAVDALMARHESLILDALANASIDE